MAKDTTILADGHSSPFDLRPDDPFVLDHIEQLIDNSVGFVFLQMVKETTILDFRLCSGWSLVFIFKPTFPETRL